jgi:hypothetical protein
MPSACEAARDVRSRLFPSRPPRLGLVDSHPPLAFPPQVEDNILDVAPTVVFFIGLVSFVKWKRQDMLKHHRD